MTARSYGQFCGLTRAADLLGNRWALPIVRDLLLGPARFNDLLAGFPGIPTSMLSARLKELETAGIVRRVVASPRGVRYELTEWGRELEPAVTALGRWGAARMVAPLDDEIVTEAGLATSLRTCFAGRRQDGPARPTTFEIFAAGLAAHATVTRSMIEVSTGPAEAPDIRISAGEHYRSLIAGQVTPDEYANLPDVEIEGNPALLSTFAELFRLPLRSLDPVV